MKPEPRVRFEGYVLFFSVLIVKQKIPGIGLKLVDNGKRGVTYTLVINVFL